MTDVGTTKRKAMSPTRRLRVFEAHGGVCVLCKKAIDGVREKWTVEHLRALGLGGPDSDDNCGPAHEACRRVKDKDDVARISKAKRAKQKHIGIVKAPTMTGRPFPKTEQAAKRQSKAADKLPIPARKNSLYAPAGEIIKEGRKA